MTQEAGVPQDFWGRIERMIENSVAKLARSGMLRNSSISGGGLTIKDGGSLQVLYPTDMGGKIGVFFGKTNSAITGEYVGTGFTVQNTDGKDIATFRSDVTSGNPVAVIRDAQENPVFSTNQNDGVGLLRPYLNNTAIPARYVDWTVSTTSATFETLFTAYGHKQHTGLLGMMNAAMDTAGTTGETRVMVNGVQVGSTVSHAFSTSTFYYGPGPVPGAWDDWLTIEFQGRRTSATGALRVGGAQWIGRPG